MGDDTYRARGVVEDEKQPLDLRTSPNGHDEEKNEVQLQSTSSRSKEDPFGDESNSEVKYKVMAWW